MPGIDEAVDEAVIEYFREVVSAGECSRDEYDFACEWCQDGAGVDDGNELIALADEALAEEGGDIPRGNTVRQTIDLLAARGMNSRIAGAIAETVIDIDIDQGIDLSCCQAIQADDPGRAVFETEDGTRFVADADDVSDLHAWRRMSLTRDGVDVVTAWVEVYEDITGLDVLSSIADTKDEEGDAHADG